MQNPERRRESIERTTPWESLRKYRPSLSYNNNINPLFVGRSLPVVVWGFGVRPNGWGQRSRESTHDYSVLTWQHGPLASQYFLDLASCSVAHTSAVPTRTAGCEGSSALELDW